MAFLTRKSTRSEDRRMRSALALLNGAAASRIAARVSVMVADPSVVSESYESDTAGMLARSTGMMQRRDMGRTPCLFEAEAVRERLLDEVHFYLAYSYKVYGARVTLSHAREPCQARFLSWVTGRSGVAVHSKFSSMRRHAWKSPSSRRHRTQDTVNSTVSKLRHDSLPTGTYTGEHNHAHRKVPPVPATHPNGSSDNSESGHLPVGPGVLRIRSGPALIRTCIRRSGAPFGTPSWP